ncbi:RAB11-binding protein RELCH homolog [Clytia hemisphaerica]|uniref:RAB11-binding protein RELCH homolog n=1 Tax=Clytia hemisphaerica TaxID=252671 RepID=UPI0034D5A7CF
MADAIIENRPDSPGKISIQSIDIPIGRKSPLVVRLSVEEVDEIAKKLLDGRFYLSALEFHTELIEAGKELSRLKEFFSNPGNFEIQSKLDPLALIRKTASNLTLDSIDDFARFSDDGLHVADERITVLEYELRKAKETIHDLREQITEMTADRKEKDTQSLTSQSEETANQYDIRTMNFLVNSYLLKREYKFTSITFSDEIGDQDLDDWEDVGLNAAQPPDLLTLYRDYSRHVVDPMKMRNQEIDDLQNTIKKLEEQCSTLNEEVSREREEKNELSKEMENTRSKPWFKNTTIEKLKNEDDTTSISSVSSKESVDLPKDHPDISNLNISQDGIDDSIETMLGNSGEENRSILNTTEEIIDVLGNDKNDQSESQQRPPSNLSTSSTGTDSGREPVHVEVENISNECTVSRQFIDLLFSTVHIKGESRLAQEVSRDEEVVPVDVIAKALPNIAPNVLLNKREELIPLILCAACFHDDNKIRDELLHMLFNLIKKPDKEQRKIIIDGCVAFAKRVGGTRIEAELLPQCWEQINHKFAERRLLVSETCGFIAPYMPVELSGSLVFSMLAQMLQDDRSEEVRSSVVRSLALIIIFITDPTKYKKVYPLLECGLKDIVEDVVFDTKEIFLPVLGLWASKMNKFQSHMLTQFLTNCKQALRTWNEATDLSQSVDGGDQSARLLVAENSFSTYIDCLVRMVTTMFVDVLSSAPFANDEITDEYSKDMDESRLPNMKNALQNPRILIGNDLKFNNLVNKFDDVCRDPKKEDIWTELDWVCKYCITETCHMAGLMFENTLFIEKTVCYLCTICRVFGKNYTKSQLIPFFQRMMRMTEASAFLNDVSPVASPLLTIFLCGVLANFHEEEQEKRLFNFTKQCLVQIATQNLSMDYLILSIQILSRNEVLQMGLIETLREAIIYPVAEVRACIATLFASLIKSANQQALSSHVAPAIITLSNDRDMTVRTASMPALGATMEVISDKNLLDKVCMQLQTILEDEESQQCIPLLKKIIVTFTKIMPGIENKIRDDFILPRLKVMSERNTEVEDLADRLEIAEELIIALQAALCCFLSRDVIQAFVLPTLKTLENNLKDFSPETVDSVLLLQKDAESKCEEDKLSTGSGASTSTSSKLFGGISSRFFKKKHEES